MWPERKISRWRGYNYQQGGAYAVTICTYKRLPVFAKIEDGMLCLHRFGRIAEQCWRAIPSHYSCVTLDDFVVMPNHIHGILLIDNDTHLQDEDVPRHFGTAQETSLSTIIGNFKSGVTRKIGEARNCPTRVWQDRFWDHVIRDERDLQRQREYISNNPANWNTDELHPNARRNKIGYTEINESR